MTDLSELLNISLYSALFGSTANAESALDAPEPETHQSDEKEVEQHPPAPFKIVQRAAMGKMTETDHQTADEALAHWKSVSYLSAAIWYLFDPISGSWYIKDSYGPPITTNPILLYMDSKYGRGPSAKANRAYSASFLSYLSPFGTLEDADDDSAETDADTVSVTAIKPQSTKTRVALLSEYMKWAERYILTSGDVPSSDLEADNAACNDLIVSSIWKLGFQCYWCPSFEDAQEIWKSRRVLYSSVWFTRNAMGSFVVYDNWGSFDQTRKIYRFVNESQESWNFRKKKEMALKKESLPTPNECVPTTQGDDPSTITPCDELEDNALCIVCFEKQKNHIMIPCGHICVCGGCKALFERDTASGDSDSDTVLCPICRSAVQNVFKIFV